MLLSGINQQKWTHNFENPQDGFKKIGSLTILAATQTRDKPVQMEADSSSVTLSATPLLLVQRCLC